ncbi:MAG: glycosyltransferase family 39 protein [Acidobacteria bacterium]|nr:glycosyltransferase family 39 protein [Acidobacteriota bacterium]
MKVTRTAAVLLGAVLILGCLWLPFFLVVVQDLPVGFHSWKQGDCYAVALRFLEDDNWNILDPRAQSLTPVDGKVNAELPLTAYLAAAGARIAGKQHLPEIYRTLTLVLSALAPLALFTFVRGRTGSFVAGLLPMVFLATCPVFVYYASGFHPDSAALGLMLMGLVVVLSSDGGKRPQLRYSLGVAVMTLGGLMKMSMAPYLLVPAAVVYFRARQARPGAGVAALLKLIPSSVYTSLGLSATLLFGQAFYLRFRAAVYGPTFFTAGPHPFRSLQDLVQVVRQMWVFWLGDLFTAPHYLLLGLGLAMLIVWGIVGRPLDDLTVSCGVIALVMISLFVLFGRQYAWHDYYAIAAFYPMAAMLVTRLALEMWRVGSLSELRTGRPLMTLLLLAASLPLGFPLNGRLETRVNHWWRHEITWLTSARVALDACGARCSGPVVVLGARSPNLPLAYLDRQGYIPDPDEILSTNFLRYLSNRGVRTVVASRDGLKELERTDFYRRFRIISKAPDFAVIIRRE